MRLGVHLLSIEKGETFMSLLKLLMRAGPVALAIGFGATSAAGASFVSENPDPFAVGNKLIGSNSCVSSGPLAGICTSNNVTTILTSNINFAGDGNEYAVVTATLSGDLSGGLGSYFLTGVYNFTLTGRSLSSGNFYGTFPLEETYVNLTGTVLGSSLQLVLDPSIPSTGFASITSLNGPECIQCDKFLISFGLDVNALFIIDGGTPVPVGSTLTGAGPVPEPSTWAMMLLGFGLAGATLRRRGVAWAA